MPKYIQHTEVRDIFEARLKQTSTPPLEAVSALDALVYALEQYRDAVQALTRSDLAKHLGASISTPPVDELRKSVVDLAEALPTAEAIRAGVMLRGSK